MSRTRKEQTKYTLAAFEAMDAYLAKPAAAAPKAVACDICRQPFPKGDIPTTVVHELQEYGPFCHRCMNLPAPRTFGALSEEEVRASRRALLDSKAHPERYVGWHTITNLGVVIPGVPGWCPRPTAGDLSVAQQHLTVAEAKEAA